MLHRTFFCRQLDPGHYSTSHTPETWHEIIFCVCCARKFYFNDDSAAHCSDHMRST